MVSERVHLATEFEFKVACFMTVGKQNDAGLRAELAGTECERAEESFCKCRRTFAQCAGQDENRVAAGHFGKAGNRVGPAGREVHEGAASTQRAGECYGTDQRMTHQGRPGFDACVEDERKDAGMQAFGRNGVRENLGSEFAGPGMGRMSLYDHRATSSQRGCCVATRD